MAPWGLVAALSNRTLAWLSPRTAATASVIGLVTGWVFLEHRVVKEPDQVSASPFAYLQSRTKHRKLAHNCFSAALVGAIGALVACTAWDVCQRMKEVYRKGMENRSKRDKVLTNYGFDAAKYHQTLPSEVWKEMREVVPSSEDWFIGKEVFFMLFESVGLIFGAIGIAAFVIDEVFA